MAGSRTKNKAPGEYAREAIAEWGDAVRYGARALAERRRERSHDRPPLRERLNPAKTAKGGKLGDVADFAMSKFGGIGGRLASKLSVGSRIVERVRDSDGGDDASATGRELAGSNGNGGDLPIPIQESIEVAVSVGVAYDICTHFEEYPEFLDHVQSAERIDDSHAAFFAKVRGRERELEVELVDERPKERLDWRSTGGIDHSGVISFHELAPRLTHIELTVELEPEGIVERLTRSAHLTERAIRAEMQRFKAYAELWEEEPEDEDEPDDEGEDEIVDEEDFDDEEGEEDFEEDELEEDEELEPAR